MTPRLVAPLTLLALLVVATPARADCLPAHSDAAVEKLPEAWRVAVDQLIRSTAEPGHPWSCVGGKVALTLDASGATLRVALEGEEAVSRQVTSPEDVVPLGQALLAVPLTPPAEVSRPSAPETSKPPAPATLAAVEAPSMPVVTSRPQPRLLLGGGVDARRVGNARATWVGPVVSAAVPMGSRWLPSISLRQQSSVGSGRGGINELSAAVAVQARLDLSPVEWRVGLAVRVAAVERQLPDRQGEQGRREGRVGAITSLVIPVFRRVSVVVAADVELVALSHEQLAPSATLGEAPRPFPGYTAGGSAMIEVPL